MSLGKSVVICRICDSESLVRWTRGTSLMDMIAQEIETHGVPHFLYQGDRFQNPRTHAPDSCITQVERGGLSGGFGRSAYLADTAFHIRVNMIACDSAAVFKNRQWCWD